MNYQSIRAKIEGPLLTAYNSQVPSIPVYFDNITFVPPAPPDEYVRVNLTFGLITENALEQCLDRARGALIIRCFAAKNKGPARCQEMLAISKTVIDEINSNRKTATDTYVRIKDINGPKFPSVDNLPHFLGRFDAGWEASAK